MGQTLTNETVVQFAREETPGVLPAQPVWKQVEPNTIDESGAQNTSVARTPISQLQQDRESTIVDRDSATTFTADTTIDSLLDFSEAFVYATAANADMTFLGAAVTATGYTIPAATAAQADKLQFIAGGPISLVHAAGYTDSANNSPNTVKEVTADVLVTQLEIPVAGLVIDAAPPINADVSIAGIRAEAGDLALAVVGNIGTLSSANNAATNNIDFTTIGLTPGQKIHVGGMTATNRFGTNGGLPNASFGSARVRIINAGTVELDKLDPSLTASDGTADGNAGALVPVDILFGRFVRNVPLDSTEYETFTHQFEFSYPNLFETIPPTPVAEPDGYGYDIASQANEMAWASPLTDKSTISFGFIGRNSEDEVDGASRKTNADTPLLPIFTAPFNTSTDFFRLGVADVDDTGLTSFFKDLTVTITNDVTPEKVLGVIGAQFMNKGNFRLLFAGDILFTDPRVTNRITNNATVTAGYLMRNLDGAVDLDVPSAKMNSTGKSFPVNESVTEALELRAFVDPLFQTSIGISFWPVYPAE